MSSGEEGNSFTKNIVTAVVILPLLVSLLLTGFALSSGVLEDKNSNGSDSQADRKESMKPDVEIFRVENRSGFAVLRVRNSGNEVVDITPYSFRVNQTEVPEKTDREELLLNPSQAIEINSTVSFPREESSIEFTVTGPGGKIVDRYMCFNSGDTTC